MRGIRNHQLRCQLCPHRRINERRCRCWLRIHRQSPTTQPVVRRPLRTACWPEFTNDPIIRPPRSAAASRAHEPKTRIKLYLLLPDKTQNSTTHRTNRILPVWSPGPDSCVHHDPHRFLLDEPVTTVVRRDPICNPLIRRDPIWFPSRLWNCRFGGIGSRDGFSNKQKMMIKLDKITHLYTKTK